MDLTFILDRLAVGEGIWTAERMRLLVELGFTHILNLQEEFDETALAEAAGLQSFWNPTGDDLMPKCSEFFEASVRFALEALADRQHKLFIHCAAGVHRAPLTAVAILWALGFEVDAAMAMVTERRVVANFPDVYVDSLRAYTLTCGLQRGHLSSGVLGASAEADCAAQPPLDSSPLGLDS